MRLTPYFALSLVLLPGCPFAADPGPLRQPAALADRAALQGSAQAQLKLAMRYENGNGVPKDAAKAMGWYEKAAAQGLPEAQRILGILYLTGTYGPANAAAGMAWLRQSANQGDAFGKTLLDFYGQQPEARAIGAVRTCHQRAIANLDHGHAAADAVTAAVQASCAAELEAWIHTRFASAPGHVLYSLRRGAHEAERVDIAGNLASLRSGNPRAPAQATR